MAWDRRLGRAGGMLIVLAGFVVGCVGSQPGTRQAATPLPENAREVRVEAKLKQRTIAFVEELLIGEPSVRVTGRTVRIRSSKGEPLWVIDGVYTDTPMGISPYDVDRMWVNATGQGYGRRGANGVIIIATKNQ